MKHLFILITAILITAGCTNNAQSAITSDSTVAANNLPGATGLPTDSVKPIFLGNGAHCFAYTKNRDTIAMRLILKDSVVAGKLVYNLYQKDKNTGIFKGSLRNDTLLANYTFSSEGVRSVRQVIFLIKGNILLQGSGSMKEQSGRLVFSNKSDVSFDGNTVLEPMDCGSTLSK